MSFENSPGMMDKVFDMDGLKVLKRLRDREPNRRAAGQMEVVGLTWDRYVWPLATGGAAQRQRSAHVVEVDP